MLVVDIVYLFSIAINPSVMFAQASQISWIRHCIEHEGNTILQRMVSTFVVCHIIIAFNIKISHEI